MGRLIGVAAAGVCVFAGIYLLQYNASDTTGAGTSWFQIIGHGMGIYFIGKGLFIVRSTWLEAEQADHLAELVRLAKPATEPAVVGSSQAESAPQP